MEKTQQERISPEVILTQVPHKPNAGRVRLITAQ